LDFNPDYADAYYNRGVARSKQGEFDLALKDFDRAIQLQSRIYSITADSAIATKACRSSLPPSRWIMKMPIKSFSGSMKQ